MSFLDPARRKALESLAAFLEYEGRGTWKREPHLELLCSKMEKVASGEIKRLMVFMPPRHGKSQVASKKFPAWYLGRNPDNYVMIASYSADLAFDFSRIARETIRAETGLFPAIRINSRSSSVKHWGIEGHKGGLIALGVGGPATGRGCNIGIIDDPFKNYEEAASHTVRESVWQWYRTTFRTRLAPDGSIVLIMTRWHEDDLAGRLILEMEQETGEQWEIISLPAIAESDDMMGRKPGEPLSPRFPLEALEDTKKAIGLYHFGALYQQRPRPEEGNFFKKGWIGKTTAKIRSLIEMWRQAGEFVQVYAAVDFAIAEKQTSDWNVITVGLITPDNEKALAGIKRFRGDSFEIAREIIDTQRTWGVLLWGLEDGQIRKAVWPYLSKTMREEGVTINAEFLVPIKDKVSRARTLQGQMRQGQWIFDETAEWYEDYEDELLSFPNAKYDDQVDSHAWLARLMEENATKFAASDVDQIAV